MGEIARHLSRCRDCEGLLDELRVVDALLTTARAPGRVGSDFTKSVVSVTRTSAPRAVKRVSLSAALLAYLAVAWACLALLATRTHDFSRIFEGIALAGSRSIAAIEAAMRAVSSGAMVVAAAVTGVLLLDLVLLVALVLGYRRLRPVLAFYLAKGPRA
jgi:hypothetical protein